MLLCFQNCGEQHISGTSEGGSTEDRGIEDLSECEQALYDHFVATYLPSFETIGCQSCHKIGGLRTVSPFADVDPFVAFDDFFRKGPNAVSAKVINEGHNSATLGYNPGTYGTQLETYRGQWNDINDACISSDTSLATSGLTTDFFDPDLAGDTSSSRCSFNDPIDIEVVTGSFSTAEPRISVLQWNLGDFREDLEGVSISLSIRINNPSIFGGGTHACPNETGYLAGKLRITSDKNLRFKNIHVRIDGDNKGVRDFWLEREVAAGADQLDLFGSGSSLVSFPMSLQSGEAIVTSNSWSLYFEEIEVIEPDDGSTGP